MKEENLKEYFKNIDNEKVIKIPFYVDEEGLITILPCFINPYDRDFYVRIPLKNLSNFKGDFKKLKKVIVKFFKLDRHNRYIKLAEYEFLVKENGGVYNLFITNRGAKELAKMLIDYPTKFHNKGKLPYKWCLVKIEPPKKKR